MSCEGIPELSTRRLGEEVARLRNTRNWSRAKLIVRLYDVLDADDPTLDHISESWLKRLENGHTVKMPRQTVEVLCQALHCTAKERARLLLYADRSIFVDCNGAPDAVAEALNYMIDRLYTETGEILAGLIGQRRAADLDEQELFELTATVLELVIKRRRRQ
jgi:transcriptional regulator with XRE-family HTH domain